MEEVKKTVEIAEDRLEALKEENQKLRMANQQLMIQAQQMDRALTDRSLDYMFKVIENNLAFSEDFVSKVVAEIERFFAIPEKAEDAAPAKEVSK